MKKNYLTRNLSKSIITLSVIFCAFFGTSGFAQKNIAWTGATDTNWSTPSNWNYPAITSVATFAAAPEIGPVVIFTASTTTLNLTGNVFNNGTASNNIPVGARVSGVGIAPNTTVTAVGAYDTTAKTTPVTLSIGTTEASDVAGNRILFQFKTKITLTAANTEIAVGDKVSGFSIPQGTTVAEIDATQKIITLSGNNLGAVGTPGTNIAFTFATPKAATGAPTIVDIAVIGNGANLTLAGGSYYLGGLTISNETGAVTGSTLNIPADAEVFVETLTNEGVLIKGGNIINNGFLDIKSSLAGGSNASAGAYGMTFSLPAVVPSVPTEYTYSGSGTLKIDTSAGTFNSGAILCNGFGVNGSNATYKILFNGTTTLLLSDKKNGAAGSSNTQAIRVAGSGSLGTCKVILGGAGFDIGDALSGGINGLFSGSGPGINVTIAPETTFNVYTNANNPSSVIGFYAYGGATSPANFTNKGTINIKGTLQRNAISMSSEYNAIINIINEGTLLVDVKTTLLNQAGLFVAGYQAPTVNTSECNLINSGTLTIKNPINGLSAGYTIFSYVDGNKSPFMNITNSGTMNLMGSIFNNGGRAFSTASPANPGSRLNNSGIVNTNQEFRAFYTTNTSSGKITFASTPDNTVKIMTFTVLAAVEAAVGTTYTDENANVHTVMVNKVKATGTTLVTSVSASIVNPTIENTTDVPPVALKFLTKTSGTGDDKVFFTNHVGNNDNAFFQRTLNSGTIITNPGTRAMTGINGFVSSDATSVLSPGGDTANGLVTFSDVSGDALILTGTLKIQATGNTTPGVDFDAMKLTGGSDTIDISGATLDVTGIYTPTAVTTIDIITTFLDPAPADPISDKSGGIIGDFASVKGLPAKWRVNNTGGLGGKIQLVYDPSLATTQFDEAKFSYYPNPTRNQLNIAAAKNISKVELFNLLGQKVQSNTVNANQKQLDITHLQNGIYLMEVTIENNKQSFKIVKQ